MTTRAWGALSLLIVLLGTVARPSASTLVCQNKDQLSTICGERKSSGFQTPSQQKQPVVRPPVKSCQIPRRTSLNLWVLESAACITRLARSPTSEAGMVSAPQSSSRLRQIEVGTAFAVNDAGDFLTNYHVLKACIAAPQLRIAGEWRDGRAVSIDERKDLAVIRTEPVNNVPALGFREEINIRAAEPVIVLGFPYAGVLTKTPQVTTGVVSAVSGIRDDARYLQTTAPVQPGNSGGPLLDSSGNIIGIVTARLNLFAAEWSGNPEWSVTAPENVNFAIKAASAREFLDANHIAYQTARSANKLDPPDVAELAAKSVVAVRCE